MSDLIPRLQFAEKIGVPVRTLDRWSSRGVRGVVFEPEYVGGRVFYSLAAYEAWRERVAAARRAKRRPARLPVKSPREHRRELEEAKTRLRAMGMRV